MTDLTVKIRSCGVMYRYTVSFDLHGEPRSKEGLEASPTRCWSEIVKFMIEAYKCQN